VSQKCHAGKRGPTLIIFSLLRSDNCRKRCRRKWSNICHLTSNLL